MFEFKVIFLVTALAAALGIPSGQVKKEQKPVARQPSSALGKETFAKYCVSCHGEDGKGHSSVASALKSPPTDLTSLSKTNHGKYPAGFISAVLKFGRNIAAHGSQDMPVWGSRFKMIDPMRDPTGQQHVDDVVAYIESLQGN